MSSASPIARDQGRPPNSSVTIALFVAALSVAGSIYLMLEMDQPYSGPIKIPSAPLRIALERLAACPLWVISRHNGPLASCPLYPR